VLVVIADGHKTKEDQHVSGVTLESAPVDVSASKLIEAFKAFHRAMKAFCVSSARSVA